MVFCFSIDEGVGQDYTGVMETAVSIPDEVVQQADELASALGLSRSELYALAIAEFISQRRDENITERLNQVYAETDSSLDVVTEQLQKISLPVERW
jgi:metal-responsive CopG/Arc/MetJ family transcriptional regulator